jgi:hypothetical protein
VVIGFRAAGRALGERAAQQRDPEPNRILGANHDPPSVSDAAQGAQCQRGESHVQLTPPGSGCSIVVGEGIVPDMPQGSLKGLQLVVPDIHAARDQLGQRGVDVSEVRVLGENPRPQPNPLDNVGFVFFSDPDGNGWAVQQISARG